LLETGDELDIDLSAQAVRSGLPAEGRRSGWPPCATGFPCRGLNSCGFLPPWISPGRYSPAGWVGDGIGQVGCQHADDGLEIR
jgi:hypothetical protein